MDFYQYPDEYDLLEMNEEEKEFERKVKARYQQRLDKVLSKFEMKDYRKTPRLQLNKSKVNQTYIDYDLNMFILVMEECDYKISLKTVECLLKDLEEE